jgi:PPOX class probable F420-dependent enzyme
VTAHEDDPPVQEFLRARRNAVLATIRRDGTAQLSPVWFLWTGERFIFSAGRQTAKAANLRRDPRITLCIIDDEPGARYLVASGTAMQVADADRREHAFAVSAKYKAPEEIEGHWEYLEQTEPQLLYTCEPQRVVWREYPPE